MKTKTKTHRKNMLAVLRLLSLLTDCWDGIYFPLHLAAPYDRVINITNCRDMAWLQSGYSVSSVMSLQQDYCLIYSDCSLLMAAKPLWKRVKIILTYYY